MIGLTTGPAGMVYAGGMTDGNWYDTSRGSNDFIALAFNASASSVASPNLTLSPTPHPTVFENVGATETPSGSSGSAVNQAVVIIGSVIGALAVLVSLGCCVFFEQRKNSSQETPTQGVEEAVDSERQAPPNPGSPSPPLPPPPDSAIRGHHPNPPPYRAEARLPSYRSVAKLPSYRTLFGARPVT